MSENFMVFSLQEKPKLIYVHLGKKPGLESKKTEKLSAQEMKVKPNAALIENRFNTAVLP